MQVDATSYNATIQEQSIGIHYNRDRLVLDYIKNPEDLEFKDGFIDMPIKPGLGVEINKDLVILENKIDSLLLIAKFILDFLCIHPFNDGNGRMSRLLTLLLLYKQGYIVPKYISFEKIIEETKDDYYLNLYDSSINWHTGNNSNVAFVKYYLSLILKAYKAFSTKIEYLSLDVKLNKSERIKKVFDDNLNKYSKANILNICPDISKIMVEKTLSTLLKENYIIKVGQGKSTKYIRNEK